MTLADYDANARRAPAWAAGLTRAAFGGALVLVVARATLPQHLRDTLIAAPLSPGVMPPPRAAGPGVGTLLDAACLGCAVLVLLRAVFDRDYTLRRTWSVAVLFALSLLTFASAIWASDKFAAAASASPWIAASALVFTFAQTVRTWSRFRVAASAAAGLLLVNVAFGIIYQFVELPGLQEDFRTNGPALLRDAGVEPGTPAAAQFENRWMKGQTGGFTASPNSYGASLVLLGFALGGVAWQRWRERDEVPGWGVVLALGLIPAAWVLWTTGSRTAMAAAVVMLIGLAALFPLQSILLRRKRLTFTALLMTVAAGAAVVVGVGLATGTLPQDSLAFRWNYWIGAWGVWRDHPILGTGFANFGDAYLPHRPPVAAEEVADPHNLIVRFFSELGIIGGLLAVLWLAWTAWDVLRPAKDADDPAVDAPASATASTLAWVVAASAGLGVLAAVDLSSDPGFVFLEVFKRCLYAAVLALGLIIGGVRSGNDGRVSNRPAPATAAAVVAGLAAVLLHATVDVVLFEPPVLMAFALLLGATLGIRAPQARVGFAARGAFLSLAVAGTLAFAVLFAVPTTVAETTAAEGDDLVRASRPQAAVRAYLDAAAWSPVVDAEPYRRAANAAIYARRPAAEVEHLLRRAQELDPASAGDLVRLAAVYRQSFDPPRRRRRRRTPGRGDAAEPQRPANPHRLRRRPRSPRPRRRRRRAVAARAGLQRQAQPR